jgi:hypothetical protein
MTHLRHAGWAGALLIPIALVIAACSGAASSSAPSTAPGSSAGTGNGPSAAPATRAPASQPPAASDGAIPSIGAIPSFDLGQLVDHLAAVDSFRVSITVNGTEQYKGIVVNKPVKASDLVVPGGTRIVTIGEEVWLGTAGGALQPAPAALAQGLLKNFDIGAMVSAYSGAGWAESSANMGTEQKNGVTATHYHIDGTTIAAGFNSLPAGATLDVWIAEAGHVVAVEANDFPGGDVSIQVTGVDDPANKIERPS